MFSSTLGNCFGDWVDTSYIIILPTSNRRTIHSWVQFQAELQNFGITSAPWKRPIPTWRGTSRPPLRLLPWPAVRLPEPGQWFHSNPYRSLPRVSAPESPSLSSLSKMASLSHCLPLFSLSTFITLLPELSICLFISIHGGLSH